MDQIDKYDYVRRMGSYKPHFEGIPESYYPLSTSEICRFILILTLTIGIVLTIMIVFQFWVINAGLESYVITWVTFFLIFFILCILFLYKGGKERRTLEK